GGLGLGRVVRAGRQFAGGLGLGAAGCLAQQDACLSRRRRPDHPVRGTWLAAALLRRKAVVRLRLAHDSRRFIVIHMARKTRTPMPARKPTIPSVTGPVRPRLNPPGFGSARSLVT